MKLNNYSVFLYSVLYEVLVIKKNIASRLILSPLLTNNVKEVLLVTGIANLKPLLNELEKHYLVTELKYKDHHQFTEQNVFLDYFILYFHPMEQNFLDVLEENVREYDGEHASTIKKAPALYSLATRLLRDAVIEKHVRLKLLSAIGYFVIPDDIYPEETHGAIGYVEDIMLLQYIFREVNSLYGKKVLLRNWDGTEEQLVKLLGEDYTRLKADYPMLHDDVLRFTGVD